MASTKLAVAIAIGVTLLLVFALGSFVMGTGIRGPTTMGPVIILLLIGINFGLIFAAIAHALVRDDLNGVQRLIWIAIAFFVTPIVAFGAIVYFALGKARTRDLFRDVNAGGRAAG